jgi:hypothetical protein
MALIIPSHGTFVNYGIGFFYSSCSEQKPLSIFENLFHLPEIYLGRQLVKLTKKSGFDFLGGWFWRGKRFSGPP